MAARKAPPKLYVVLSRDGFVLDAYVFRRNAADSKQRRDETGNVPVRVVRYDLHEPKPKRARKARRAG